MVNSLKFKPCHRRQGVLQVCKFPARTPGECVEEHQRRGQDAIGGQGKLPEWLGALDK